MPDDLARIAAGLPVAALWPLTLPFLAATRFRTTVASTASALYVLAPLFPSATAFILLALAAATSCALCQPNRESASSRPRLPPPAVLAALFLAVVAALLSDLDRGRDGVGDALESNAVALTAIGLVACVFLGGATVAWILRPFTIALERNEASLPSLDSGGRYIGWFERAVLFAFVMGGQPEAAAIALAAKSFARFPTLQERHEGFAEYFLIGSLASLTIAVALAIATRAALGFTAIA